MVCILREQANIAMVADCVGLSRFSTWCYRTVKLKLVKWLRCHLRLCSLSWQAALCLSDCAWWSHGTDGLLLPCKQVRPLNLSAQCPPEVESASVCVFVWSRRCARVVKGFSLYEFKHIFHLKIALTDLINVGSFFFVLSEPLRAFGIPLLL